MGRARLGAMLWLLAGIAFVVAGVMADRRQGAFFAVAVVFFALSVLTLRRARSLR